MRILEPKASCSENPVMAWNAGLTATIFERALVTTTPSVGSDPLPDTAYINSTNSGNYGADTGNLGAFGQGTGWTPYTAAVEFSTPAAATPEPSPLLLLATGLLALVAVRLGAFKGRAAD